MEPAEAALRSAEIQSEGGKPIVFYETQNVRPGVVIAIAQGVVAYEGTLMELGMSGIFEKDDLLVFLHPHTKAALDAKIKKSTRKFKPGEAMPGQDRIPVPNGKAREIEERRVAAAPELGMPYEGNPASEGDIYQQYGKDKI